MSLLRYPRAIGNDSRQTSTDSERNLIAFRHLSRRIENYLVQAHPEVGRRLVAVLAGWLDRRMRAERITLSSITPLMKRKSSDGT